MWYMIYGEDVDNSLDNRLAVRDKHLERLQTLQAQGRLLVAGPLPAIDCDDPGTSGFTGSLLIVEFDSLDQAQQWAEQDPYVDAGVYKKVTVKPFKKVLGI
ncbi:YciI family protein [Thalassotalea ponticola]|uniref:YciI family protein n=1 Tax=Thalassotalea ponticola TaxID=1523392 RepID=UPI0025B3542F|nr:YciI family protein [Thalassotalea ponticola]MDN3651259.1 YciI family protein [Thalassotalea ponticola]